MVERKLYKTRLCLLYERGSCSRRHCNFAHGDVQLRRSVNEWSPCDGRQDYHGGDLRESLRRKRSPVSAYPPGRDTKPRHSSYGNSPPSPGRRIDRNHRKRHQLDSFHDYSGNLRVSDGTEDRNRERRQTSSDSKVLLDEQHRRVQAEIKVLDNDKRELEVFLEKKAQETDTLTLKIHELEVQLAKEKDEARRITSKIKKFIKAHNRHLRLQEELKRSYAQVQKLGEQLDLDAARPETNEEDPKAISVSEDEMGVNYAGPLIEYRINYSPSRKRSRVSLEDHDVFYTVKGDKPGIGKTRSEKLSETAHYEQLSGSRRLDVDGDVNNGHGPLSYEDKHRRGIYQPPDIVSAEKVPESGYALPPTGLAAHAMDEDVEVVETDEKFEATGAVSNGADTKVTLKPVLLPFPLPPPPLSVPRNVYSQYEGNDEHVDIDELDDETVEVDIV